MSFVEFEKIARLTRGCSITEKIDGTNAQVFIDTADIPQNPPVGDVPWVAEVGNLKIAAGSRNRWVTPEADNFGFARWVKENALALAGLGVGRHYGEWWGSGVQRGYDLPKGEKRFSLFNVGRWVDAHHGDDPELLGPKDAYAPLSCHVVPVLYRGIFSTSMVDQAVEALREVGSKASPGFMKPEGVVIWHEAARCLFKKTLERDEEPKGAAR